MRFTRFQRQRGVTLVVALIMLVIISMLAMTTFNLGKSSIQVVSNMQSRDEGIAASQQVIDEVLSNKLFFETPQAALSQPCQGPNTRCLDVNGDGQADVTTVLSPQPACIKARTIKSRELNLDLDDDKGCIQGDPQGQFGVENAVTGNSMCALSTWEIAATSTDAVTETSVTVVQGVNVRVASDDVETSCK